MSDELFDIGSKVLLVLAGSGGGYLGAAFRVMRKVLDFERKLEALEQDTQETKTALKELRALVEKQQALSSSQFNEFRLQLQTCSSCRFEQYVSEDTQRWRELERTLGQIEGRLLSAVTTTPSRRS